MSSFQDRMEHLNLEGDEGKKALRWLLEHLAIHDSDPCFLGARSLMSQAESAEGGDKNILLAEMFGYLVRVLEDFGAACMMWLVEGRHPVEAYLGARPLEIRGFFAECRKGLPEEKLVKVYGVARGATLCDLNWMSRAKSESDAPMLDWVTKQRLEQLANLAKIHQQTGPEPNEMLGPWQVAASKSRSFNLLKSGEGNALCQNLLLGVGDNPDPKQPGKQTPALFFLKMELSGDFAEKIFYQIDEILLQRAELANLRMDMSYDPRAALAQAQQAWDQMKVAKQAEKAAQEKTDAGKAKPETAKPKEIEKPKTHEGSELMPAPAPPPKAEEKKQTETGTQVIGGLKIKRGLDELWS